MNDEQEKQWREEFEIWSLSENPNFDFASSHQGYDNHSCEDLWLGYLAARKKAQEEQRLKNDKALEALEWMRDWAFGTSEMEPQVTYVPAMNKFENRYLEIKQALEAR